MITTVVLLSEGWVPGQKSIKRTGLEYVLEETTGSFWIHEFRAHPLC